MEAALGPYERRSSHVATAASCKPSSVVPLRLGMHDRGFPRNSVVVSVSAVQRHRFSALEASSSTKIKLPASNGS